MEHIQGNFTGAAATHIVFDANGFPGLTLTFNVLLDFPQVAIRGFTVNFNGIYGFINESDLSIENDTSFEFKSLSEINNLGQLSNYFGEVIFADNPNDYRIKEFHFG